MLPVTQTLGKQRVRNRAVVPVAGGRFLFGIVAEKTKRSLLLVVLLVIFLGGGNLVFFLGGIARLYLSAVAECDTTL